MFDESTPSLEQRQITFMDSSLRDGEQTPGVVYTPEAKVQISSKLDEIGVESIDAGFAAVSEEERQAIRKIVAEGFRFRVYTLCRSRKEDIDHAIACGVDGVLLFAPTSEIMIKAKFGDDLVAIQRQILEMAETAIKYAKDKGLYVTFGAEDSTRTPLDYLLEVMGRADEAGADMLGFADTVGVMSPHRFYQMISRIRQAFPHKKIKIHCHNDYGLANINSVAGVLAGADDVDVTIGGLGERAGNAALEEVAMTLKHLYGAPIRLNTEQFQSAVQLVQKLSGVRLAPNKSVVGPNAFAHESGIHTHAVLNNPLSYEPYAPEEVGNVRRIIFGKHSGRNTVKKILENHGVTVQQEGLEKVLDHLKLQSAELTEDRVLQLYQQMVSQPHS